MLVFGPSQGPLINSLSEQILFLKKEIEKMILERKLENLLIKNEIKNLKQKLSQK